MGRWVLIVTMLTVLGMGSTLYLAIPDTALADMKIKEPLQRIGARIGALFGGVLQDRSEAKYVAAKDQAWAEWQARFPVAQDCINPQTETKTSECRKAADLTEELFERHWDQSIASGWVPSYGAQPPASAVSPMASASAVSPVASAKP